jgi:hypothetical protein
VAGSLLRNRDFRLVSGSVGLSALGDWVAMVALGLHVKEITDSGFAVAGLWICLFGPSVLVAGHAGLLVDRVEATRLLALVSGAGAVLALGLGFLSGLAPILVMTALLGVVFAVSQPAEFALVPLLAGEDRIQVANGHMETIRYIGFGLGPLLGACSSPSAASSWQWPPTPSPSPSSPAPPWRCGSGASQRSWTTGSVRRALATGSPSSSAIALSRW